MADDLIFDLLDRRVVAGEAEHLVVRAGDKTLDVAALVELSGSFGGALRQLGAAPGDAVRIGSVGSLESLVALLGVLRIGAVADLGATAELDATTLDHRVAIGAGRTDPAASMRLSADAPAVLLADGTVVSRRALMAAATGDASAAGELGTVLDSLRALSRGEILTFDA